MGLLVSELGEFGLIDMLKRLRLARGIGDDCAVITPQPGHDLVVTADALIEGVHFRHEWMPWWMLGEKAMGVNVSDLAAMGADPAGIVITLGLKPDAEYTDVMSFYMGMKHGLPVKVPVVGGDIVASPCATAISITAYGYVPHGKAIRRKGARAGDDIWVTGALGASSAGLKLLQTMPERYAEINWDEAESRDVLLVIVHHIPAPRVLEGKALAGTGRVHAMIDVSDGLAGDLGHILRSSKVGAVLEEAALPICDQVREASAEYGWDPLDLALHGGEDYELLFTASARWRRRITAAVASVHGAEVTRIGTIVEGSGLVLRRADGTEEPLEPKAFTHF